MHIKTYSRIPLIWHPWHQTHAWFLISNSCRVLNGLRFLLGNSLASELDAGELPRRKLKTCLIVIYSGLLDSIEILQPAIGEYVLVHYFHFNHHKPSHWCSFRTHCRNPLYSILSSCTKLGCFNAYDLRKSFTPSFDATKKTVIGPVSVYHKWQSHVVWSHNHTSSFIPFNSTDYLEFISNH
jgi:hypothetical protein